MTHAVGVHHRDADAALAAVLVEDRGVDLEPARGLHVDVDVGQRLPQRREEALHEQVVPQRVDPGDPEQVVDQAARTRPPGGAAHPHLPDQVGDVADGEEVGGVAQLADQLQLVVEPLPDPLLRRAVVTPTDPCLATRPEHPVRGAGPRGSDGPGTTAADLELREVDLPQPEVCPRVQRTPVGGGPGPDEQVACVPVAEAGVPADLLGHLVHLLAGLEEPLGVAPVHMPQVERDQPTRGVEDVDGGGVEAVGVAHRVGEQDAEPGLAGHPCHPGGMGRGAGGVTGQPVGDDLHQEVLPGHDLAPPGQHLVGPVVATQRGRLAERRGGPEQDDHVAAAQVLGDQLRVGHRPAPLPGQVGGRDQPADRRPAGPPTGQEGDPGQPRVAERPSPDRCARPARSRGLDTVAARTARPGSDQRVAS